MGSQRVGHDWTTFTHNVNLYNRTCKMVPIVRYQFKEKSAFKKSRSTRKVWFPVHDSAIIPLSTFGTIHSRHFEIYPAGLQYQSVSGFEVQSPPLPTQHRQSMEGCQCAINFEEGINGVYKEHCGKHCCNEIREGWVEGRRGLRNFHYRTHLCRRIYMHYLI